MGRNRQEACRAQKQRQIPLDCMCISKLNGSKSKQNITKKKLLLFYICFLSFLFSFCFSIGMLEVFFFEAFQFSLITAHLSE